MKLPILTLKSSHWLGPIDTWLADKSTSWIHTHNTMSRLLMQANCLYIINTPTNDFLT